MPLETEPKIKAPIPTNSEKYKVKDGDSWESIARRIGIDVWKLIDFNFKTKDPREVNWYLRDYVGCNLPTNDKLNWRFSSSANPGIIYLPKKVMVFQPLIIEVKRKHNSPVTETLLEHEGDVSSGALKVNDAFDLSLFSKSDGNYILGLFMKVQFFFIEESGLSWTQAEKNDFLQKWDREVRGAFDNQVIKVLSNGKTVLLRLSFEKQIEGFMLDHWEVTVHKVLNRSNLRSSVNTFSGNVDLTHLDNTPQSFCTARACFQQVTSVHEFTHMLGDPDEYGPQFGGKVRPFNWDLDSVTNVGSRIRSRHKIYLKNWVEEALSKHNIK
jgi:hypothetical protein